MTNEKEKQPMSKSQKKRLKRNKAKKRAEEEEEPSSPVLQQQQPKQDPLNPHAKLRNDLLSLGYSVEEIDKGMEEMWNLGMQYDELEAVTSFLEDKRELWASEVNVQPVAAAVVEEDVVEEAVVVEDEKDSEVNTEKEEDLSADTSTRNEPDETTAATPDDVNEDGTEGEAVPAMDLISKLEVVSDFENLQDALFALSEWVNKAAKPHELFEFCGVKDESTSSTSSPFATILKRSISYSSSDSNADEEYYRTVILPYLNSLLSGLLVSHVDTAGVVDQLLNVIYLSRSAIKQLMSSTLPSSVRDNISIAVSRLISGLVHKNLVSNAAGGSSTDSPQLDLMNVTNELEEMLSQVESQPPQRGCGVVELMTERDCRKCLAEKACDLSKLLLQSLLNEKDGNAISSSSTQQLLQSNEAKLTMFSSLLGEHSSTVQSGVRSYRDVESRIKGLQADLTLKHAEVAAESLRVHSDLQHIARRKNELRLELEQLERNEVLLQNRETELNKILTTESGGSEVAFLQSQREEFVGMVRTDDSLRSLVDKMSEFEMVLFTKKDNGDAVTQSFDVSAKDVEGKMTLLLEQMQNYFSAEAAIIKFLQHRVENMKAEHKDLQQETLQFKALGLTTNVNQMNQSLDEISRNITEDESVLTALRLEATEMETSLYERIKDYVNAPTGNCVLSSVHRAALSNIIQSLMTSGVTDVSKLSSFLPPSDSTGTMNGSRSSVPIAAPAKTRPAAPQAPQSPPPAQESVSLKPMLNWATVGSKAPAQKKEVKSLLDIQKEEMSAKQAAT